MATAVAISVLVGASMGSLFGILSRYTIRQRNAIAEENRVLNPYAVKHSITVKEDIRKTYMAITREILQNCDLANGKYIREDSNGPTLFPADGNYKLAYNKENYLYIVINESEIKIDSYSTEITAIDMHRFIREIVKKYYGSTPVNLLRYTNQGGDWGSPETKDRRPYKHDPRIDCEQVKNALDYVKAELNKGNSPKIMLHGPSRSGKTTTMEEIASRLVLNIYDLTLNDYKSSDAVIKSLIQSVPENSILVIDELNIQLRSAIKAQNGLITPDCILSGIDSVARMPKRCVVAFATSNLEETLSLFPEGSLAGGRVDKYFEFKKQEN